MKFKFLAVIAALGMFSLTPVPEAAAREPVSIRRIRPVPNPAPDRLAGEEALEVTFSLRHRGWVRGIGWSLRYYDGEKNLLDTVTDAYIDPGKNPMSRIIGHSFKGDTVFILYFPLREEADYMVLTLGDGVRPEVVLYPYTALLEDFRIPIRELNRETARARLLVLEE